jgi:hypothetical protein
MKENPRFTRGACISNQTEGEGSIRLEEGKGVGGERGRRRRCRQGGRAVFPA